MKRALELKGIWVIVGDEREIGMDAIWVGDWRGAKLQVKEHDVNSALAVLGIETEHLESDACKAKARGEIRCPDCASSNLRYERYSKWGVYGAWQRARPGGRFAERKWLCRDCGYVWSVNEE
jgi:hypothetical protein